MSTAKTIGRRLFSRAAVGVPTALKFGGSSPGAPPLVQGFMAGSNPAQGAAVAHAYKAIRLEHKDERQFEEMRAMRRHMMGGLDPDLAVLNSMSLQRRVQIQMDREKAARERLNTLSARIMRRFGLDPEEFQ